MVRLMTTASIKPNQELRMARTYEVSKSGSGIVSGNPCCNREMVNGVCRGKECLEDVMFGEPLIQTA